MDLSFAGIEVVLDVVKSLVGRELCFDRFTRLLEVVVIDTRQFDFNGHSRLACGVCVKGNLLRSRNWLHQLAPAICKVRCGEFFDFTAASAVFHFLQLDRYFGQVLLGACRAAAHWACSALKWLRADCNDCILKRVAVAFSLGLTDQFCEGVFHGLQAILCDLNGRAFGHH